MSKPVAEDLIREINLCVKSVPVDMISYRSADINAICSENTMVVVSIDENYSSWWGYRLDDDGWFLAKDLELDYVSDNERMLELVAEEAAMWLQSYGLY